MSVEALWMAENSARSTDVVCFAVLVLAYNTSSPDALGGVSTTSGTRWAALQIVRWASKHFRRGICRASNTFDISTSIIELMSEVEIHGCNLEVYTF